MKRKHYFLLLLIVTTLLVSCPVNHSSPTPPSKPDIVVPDEPSAPTTDVEGSVEEPEITAWTDALSALVHCYSKVNYYEAPYAEHRGLTEFTADTDVELQDPSNNMPANRSVTIYNGSYLSSEGNSEGNNSTNIGDISGKYNDSDTSFQVYINGTLEDIGGGEASFNGTATYTEGSTTSQLDLNELFSGQIEDKNSPEYKVNMIMYSISHLGNYQNICKYTFTNYEHPEGYIFDGKTVGVEKAKTKDNAFVSDQKYTDGTVSVTLQGDVKLIVRYDIKREGESKTITDTSYMHVKRVGDKKFKVFPLGELTL